MAGGAVSGAEPGAGPGGETGAGPGGEPGAGPGGETGAGPGGARLDEVDRLLADWRRERPDLDLAPLAVMSRLSRLARRLDTERKDVLESFGLEGWSFDVLAALRRTGAPYELPPRILLRQTLVSSGAMTNRIDRLETAGLVVRRPDPRDRRGVLVRLTAPGRRRVDDCLSTLAGREHALLAPLRTGDRALLADLLHRLLLPLDPPAPGT